MEKVLTLPPSKYEKYLRDASEKVSEEEKHKPEAYAYGQVSNSFSSQNENADRPNIITLS
jgi:hypothetical protein